MEEYFHKNVIIPLQEFIEKGKRFISKCDKPGSEELRKTALATLVGLLILGIVGFFIKLIFMGINNLIIN